MNDHVASIGSAPAVGLDADALSDLAGAMRGERILPADDGYGAACALWNGMLARRPALILRPLDTDGVIEAVRFARAHRLPLSVRAGGHNVAGTALCDGGVAIDLANLRAVRVDADARTARAEGGARLGDLDRATQPHGLAAPLGVVSRTGAAGLTLHGGLGFLTRKHGLSCDNLIAAEVVTADGRLVRADASQNTDLLWALRGGGGNFGVVTALEFRLHPIGPDVFLFLVMYPAAEALTVLAAFREFMATAPDEVMGLGILWNTPEADPLPEHARNVPAVILVGAHCGAVADGERAVKPLRRLATPLADLSGPMPFLDVQQLFDPDYPDGRRYYWKSIYLSGLGDDVIGALARHARARPSSLNSIDVWALGGALRREPAGGSAFSKRDAPFLLGIEANWDDPAADDANVGWAREVYADMGRFSAGGLYLNFPGFMEEGPDLLRATYGPSWDRLRAVKAAYDPENLFRSNFNVAPLAAARG